MNDPPFWKDKKKLSFPAKKHYASEIFPGIYDLPKRHGKLKELHKFDASFFGITPKQANHMDPQQLDKLCPGSTITIVSVDSACSSSLLALNLALDAIRQGQCNAAIVAGANLNLSPMTALQCFVLVTESGWKSSFQFLLISFQRSFSPDPKRKPCDGL
uniref:Beta-ketoacyl synthase N-terminal domain-containing protein n=1 Tax=Acrobeloides nanus TaxID=290746 RepID=A0A914EJB8_9BILA